MWRRLLLGILLVVSATLAEVSPAMARPLDLGCSDVNHEGSCSQYHDTGGDSFWCNTIYATALGSGYNQRCLRSLEITGTNDGYFYALFGIQTYLNPDPNDWVYIWSDSSEDSSEGCANCTIHTRLWSNNARGTCPGGSICNQQNYVGLEQGDNCDQNGDSETIGATVNVGDASINWSQTNPLYYGCTYATAVPDIYSRYYDYTLMDTDNNQDEGAVVQTTTFSQIAPGGLHSIQIGLLEKGIFDCFNSNCPGSGVEVTTTGNWFDSYTF